MENNSKNLEYNVDETLFSDIYIHVKNLYLKIASKKRTLLIALLIGGFIGLTKAYLTKITFTSKVSFVLEETKSGGSLSALAGQFGFDLGSVGGGSGMLSGDNIIGLLTSKQIVEKVLLSSYSITNKYSIADKYADVYGLKKKWKKKFPNICFPSQENRIGYNRIQDSLLQIIEEIILKKNMNAERKDKKMTFILVSATMEDEELCALFSDRIVKEAANFYIETKTRRSKANVNRLQNMADSILWLLNKKTYALAASQSKTLDINPSYSEALVETEISSRTKLTMATIYTEVMKNLLVQKATLTQETPVIQIVDPAYMPLKKNKPSKLLSIFAGCFTALILTIVFLIIHDWWSGVIIKFKPDTIKSK
jgi:hypothetical protein